MIGIRKGQLERMLIAEDRLDIKIALNYVIQQCKELDPWMTLEEFSETGFEGWCWIINDRKYTQMAYFYEDVFYWNDQCFDDSEYQTEAITHVQPIRKPEPLLSLGCLK